MADEGLEARLLRRATSESTSGWGHRASRRIASDGGAGPTSSVRSARRLGLVPATTSCETADLEGTQAHALAAAVLYNTFDGGGGLDIGQTETGPRYARQRTVR